MNWQVLIEFGVLALLALGLIIFASREVGKAKSESASEVAKAAKEAEWATERRWSAKFHNLEVLRNLQIAFGSLPVTVFGSSQEDGAFTAPNWHSDVDLMVEVDEDIFAAWAAKVYGADANTEHIGVGDPFVHTHDWEDEVEVGTTIVAIPTYFNDSPTRLPRREAAKKVLGIDIEGLDLKVDIFLFPHSFVRGEMSIPSWDGTAPETEGRSFRKEVLAGTRLADLQPAG